VIGAGKIPENDVIGETPNLAARLQMLAEPNGIVIAASARQLLGNLYLPARIPAGLDWRAARDHTDPEPSRPA
jgi:class 3 adenylate cyclase